MSFGSDLRRFAHTVQTRHDAIFEGVGQRAFDSIVEGSPVTGAPGQPVGQYGPGYHPGKVGGTLKASWQRWYDSPLAQIIATNLIYAPIIEDGVGPYGPITLRSTVGGFHSVKLTIAGLPQLVADVTREVVGA